MTSKKTLKFFKNQEYKALKKQLTAGKLFLDPEFKACDENLLSAPNKVPNVEWKRPGEITPNPHFFVDGADSGDVHQGSLGNCWFVAACSSLGVFKEILNTVIPEADQQTFGKGYRGIFYFHFWRYGEWTEVVVDDRLPTVCDELIFVHSQSRNEFWSALLEKAYAKLFGSYEALDGGELSEALEDFTGGVSENFNMVALDLLNRQEELEDFFNRLEVDSSHKSLMAASIPPRSIDEMEAHTTTGLVIGHAYGITAVRSVNVKDTGLFDILGCAKLPMIRLRNPWGQVEWNGAFSDGSPEWNMVTEADKETMGLDFEDDGEFWMHFEDFVDNFVDVAVCHVVNTSFFSISKTWHEGFVHGSWTKSTAGGCMNHRDTFLTNPQYKFDVKEDDDEVMVQLIQKSTRLGAQGSDNKPIGFTILRCEVNRRIRIHNLDYFTKVGDVTFSNTRSISFRENLPKGRYVLIPSTFEQGVKGDYLLRLYTSNSSEFEPLLLDQPPVGKGACSCCGGRKHPKMVTQVKMKGAWGLQTQDLAGGADPYCTVTCEGNKVSTPVRSNNLNPEWDTWALFYRFNPQNPIKFQIWNSDMGRDQHMGTFSFAGTEAMTERRYECPLLDAAEKEDVPGVLIVHIAQTPNLKGI